jgi:hypothetical protein
MEAPATFSHTGVVFPLRSEGDDDIARPVPNTLGPFRLERRLTGPSQGDADLTEVPPVDDPADDPMIDDRGRQNQVLHQGATVPANRASARATPPGVCSSSHPAACNVARRVPPR